VFDTAEWTEVLAVEPQQYYKIVIPAGVAVRQTEISAGSHYISWKHGEIIPSVKMENIFLAHLPVRTATQTAQKIVSTLVAIAIARGTAWWGKESVHITPLLDEMLKSGAIGDIRRVSLTYMLTDKSVPLPETEMLDSANLLPPLPMKYGSLRADIPQEASLFGRLISNIRPIPGILQNRVVAVENAASNFSATGAFSAEFHSRILKCDWPPVEFAEKRIAPASILDIGCGLGAYLAVFQSRGKRVLGIDGSDHGPFHLIPENAYIKADLTETLVSTPEIFDMGICLETLEHLPFAAGVRIVELLARQCRKAILFSVAQPHQPGFHHITLVEVERWIEEFSKRGWHVDCRASLSMRFLASYHWFRKNLFLLLPGPLGEDNARLLPSLLQIGMQTDEWPDQASAGVVSWPGEIKTFAIRSKDVFEPLETAARDIGSMEGEIDQLRSHLSSASRDIDSMRREIDQLRSHFSSATDRLDRMESEAKRLLKELTHVETQRTNVLNAIAAWNRRPWYHRAIYKLSLEKLEKQA
jgi:SAM-dependent methyltransferase